MSPLHRRRAAASSVFALLFSTFLFRRSCRRAGFQAHLQREGSDRLAAGQHRAGRQDGLRRRPIRGQGRPPRDFPRNPFRPSHTRDAAADLTPGRSRRRRHGPADPLPRLDPGRGRLLALPRVRVARGLGGPVPQASDRQPGDRRDAHDALGPPVHGPAPRRPLHGHGRARQGVSPRAPGGHGRCRAGRSSPSGSAAGSTWRSGAGIRATRTSTARSTSCPT